MLTFPVSLFSASGYLRFSSAGSWVVLLFGFALVAVLHLCVPLLMAPCLKFFFLWTGICCAGAFLAAGIEEWHGLGFKSDPVRNADLQDDRAGRRRRIDEDLVDAVVNRAPGKKTTAAQVAHIALGDDVDFNTKCIDRLPAYMVANWRQYDEPDLGVAVTYDGYRIGNPQEETMNYGFSNSWYGSWGAPMVL